MSLVNLLRFGFANVTACNILWSRLKLYMVDREKQKAKLLKLKSNEYTIKWFIRLLQYN